MLAVVFVLLMAATIALWACGFASWLVLPVAAATWVAFYLMAYPKIRTYKVAMGVDDRLNGLESRGWVWLVLHMKGLKVVLLGALTSLMPFASNLISWASSKDFSIFFGPENTAKVTFWVGLAVFVLPFVSSWLHVGAVQDAATTEPKA